jgi:hypothetical protein
MKGEDPIRLRLYSRPGCHLCDQMRQEVDELLADRAREWEVVDFARVRLPRLAQRLRLLRAADRKAEPLRTGLA